VRYVPGKESVASCCAAENRLNKIRAATPMSGFLKQTLTVNAPQHRARKFCVAL
jgi:hypothetical protein